MNILSILNSLRDDAGPDPRLPAIMQLAAAKKRSPQRNIQSAMPVIDPDAVEEPPFDEYMKDFQNRAKGYKEGTAIGPPSPRGIRGHIQSSDPNGAYAPGYGYGNERGPGPTTEQEVDDVHKQFDKPVNSPYRIPERDLFAHKDEPNYDEKEADFEAAAASNDPIEAYKKLVDKWGLHDLELNHVIEGYSGQ